MAVTKNALSDNPASASAFSIFPKYLFSTSFTYLVKSVAPKYSN